MRDDAGIRLRIIERIRATRYGKVVLAIVIAILGTGVVWEWRPLNVALAHLHALAYGRDVPVVADVDAGPDAGDDD